MLRLAIALGISAFAAAPVAALPDTIYVMRHLERDPGQDPDLNAVGAANAERLASWFARNPPKAIYVSQFRRSQQTAAPLAKKLKLSPVGYQARAPEAIYDGVRASKGPVLIVAHNNTVPVIVEALGGPKAAGDLEETDYGRIWILQRGKLRVVRLAEPQPR